LSNIVLQDQGVDDAGEKGGVIEADGVELGVVEDLKGHGFTRVGSGEGGQQKEDFHERVLSLLRDLLFPDLCLLDLIKFQTYFLRNRWN
jgi:hypothetical protein